MGQRHDIGGRTPGAGDADGHRCAALRQVDGLQRVQPVADDGDRRLAGEARRQADLRRLAIGIGRLVEADLQHVGRVGLGLGDIADVEGDRGLGAVGTLGADVEPIGAPADGRLDAGRPVGGELDLAVRDAAGALHRLIGPFSVLEEPLVVPLHAGQRPFHAGAGEAAALSRRHHHVEAGRLAVAERSVLEQGLDADDVALGQDRQRDDTVDAAAAVLRDADDDLRLERQGRLGFGQGDGEAGLAGRVGRRLLLDVVLHRLDALVGESDAIAGEAGDRMLGRRADGDRAADLELGAGRAIEVARLDIELSRLARAQRRALRLDVGVQPLGHVILDQKARLADRVALGIGIGLDAPGAGRGAADQRQREGAAAAALILDRSAAIFDAVRPPDDERQRQTGDGDALGIAGERRQVNRLAGAIDAALGVEEGVEPFRSDPALHAAIGEVEGGLLEVEEAVILAGARRHEAGREAALAPREAGVEAGEAVGVGRGRAEDLIVAGEELHLDVAQRLGVGQRAHQHMHALRRGEAREAEVGDDEPLGARVAALRIRIIIGGLRCGGLAADQRAERPSGRRRAAACRAPPAPGRRSSRPC